MLALRWRSAIWVDNRWPLMCEVRGKRWLKYIIIIILENSEVQWSRGSIWNKYIEMSYTKSYLRMPCSIYWNTSSFTIFEYIIWYGFKTTYITQYTIMMSLQRSRNCVSKHNIILRNLGYRYEPKVFVKNPKEPVQFRPCE